jgi:transcription initiation factor IIE alpha subunit
MANRLPVQSAGKWTFHLQHAQTLQFRISSEQEANTPLVIEDHDISALLDYLYENRELIYEATHDQERRRLEATEALNSTLPTRREKRQVEHIFYIDDGVGRKQEYS